MAAFIFVMNFVMILDKCCTYSVYRLYIYGFEPRLSLFKIRAVSPRFFIEIKGLQLFCSSFLFSLEC